MQALILSLLVWFPPQVETSAPGDKATLREVASRLKTLKSQGKLSAKELTLSIFKGSVTVYGYGVPSKDVQQILNVIYATKGVKTVHLHLGLKQRPTMPYPVYPDAHRFQTLWKAPLQWDDGHWNLDFTNRPNIRLP